MTCKNCGTHKEGECYCDETLIVSVDNGTTLKFVTTSYAEFEKFQRMNIEIGEVHCYPFEALVAKNAEELKGMLI